MFTVKFKQIIFSPDQLQCSLDDLLSLKMITNSLPMDKNGASIRELRKIDHFYTAALLIVNDILLGRPLRPHIHANVFVTGPINSDHIANLQCVIVHACRI